MEVLPETMWMRMQTELASDLRSVDFPDDIYLF